MPARPQRVILADPNLGDRAMLAAEFGRADWVVLAAETWEETRLLAQRHPSALVVLELRLRDGSALFKLPELRASGAEVVVLTAHGSIAAAVAAVRLGATAFLEKPRAALEILARLRAPDAPEVPPRGEMMSLERSRWEYMCRASVACRTVSSASRELGLDRRSLRRMLGKRAP